MKETTTCAKEKSQNHKSFCQNFQRRAKYNSHAFYVRHRLIWEKIFFRCDVSTSNSSNSTFSQPTTPRRLFRQFLPPNVKGFSQKFWHSSIMAKQTLSAVRNLDTAAPKQMYSGYFTQMTLTPSLNMLCHTLRLVNTSPGLSSTRAKCFCLEKVRQKNTRNE